MSATAAPTWDTAPQSTVRAAARGQDRHRRSTGAVPFHADASTAYRELAPAVLGYLRARRAPDPEDVLGEVFLQVSRDLDRFRGDATDLRRWVFTIAHNRMTDAFRRRSRRPQVVDREPPMTVAPPDPVPVDAELIAALQQLGEDQREVVVLRFVADLSLDDVAAITGRNVNAVKAMQHRALANLRRALTAVEPTRTAEAAV